MALFKLKEYYPYYQEVFNSNDIINFVVYSQDSDIGSVKNIMVDEDGHFRYFIFYTGFWILGKQVLLPMAMAAIYFADKRVYAEGLTKQQVKDLPELTEKSTINADYEERVRGIYRQIIATPTTKLIFDINT